MNSTGSYSENLHGTAAQRAPEQGLLQAAVIVGAGPGAPPIAEALLGGKAH
jgi:hypothetical protein